MNEIIEKLKLFREKKRFAVRGATFAKKMWRDGYNKAIDDIITYLEMEDNDTPDHSTS